MKRTIKTLLLVLIMSLTLAVCTGCLSGVRDFLEPTQAPTEEPTQAPTEEPTQAPTEEPTQAPTECKHNYEAVVTAPTCTEKGYTTYTCSACGDTYKGDETATIAHSYESIVTAPTCTDKGYTTYTCSVCGHSYKDNETSATGHFYATKVVTPPTCTENGYITYSCDCGAVYKIVGDEATGHNHKGVVTAPTCTEQGYTTYTCVCGDSYVSDYTGPHNADANGVCTGCGYVLADTAEKLIAAAGAGKNVLLMNDLTLNASLKCPYGNPVGVAQKGGIIDGNGHTLTVNGAGNCYAIITYGGTIKNLTIGNCFRGIVTYTPAEDIILDNITIVGNNVVYGLNTAEHATKAGIKLIVKNSTVCGWNSIHGNFASVEFENVTFAQGMAYGNVIGRLIKPFVNTTFTNCTFVKNAYLDMSELVAGCTVTFNGGTVGGINITKDVFTTVEDHAEIPFTYEAPKGVTLVIKGENGLVSFHSHKYQGVVTAPTCTEQGYTTYTCVCGDSYVSDYTGPHNADANGVCTGCGYVLADTAEKLIAAAGAGKNVLLMNDLTLNASLKCPYGNPVGVAQKGGIIDGNGHTLTVNGAGNCYAIITYGGTIKNLTIGNCFRGIVTYTPAEDIILDNITIVGNNVVYGLNTAEHATKAGIKLIVKNSTVCGWNSIHGNFASVEFENVTFAQGMAYGNVIGRLIKPFVNTTFTNCTFVKNAYLDMSELVAGCTVTFNGGTVGGVNITKDVFTTVEDHAEIPFTYEAPKYALALKSENGVVSFTKAAVSVNDVNYVTLEEAAAAAKAGDTITLLSDVTLAAELTLPAGITFNGNGKQVNGTIYAGGDLTFAGHTKVTAFSASYYNRTITIGVGACLEITGGGRVSLAYGNVFNITGSIENAKTADKTKVQPSLIIPAGISITGGSDATLNVTNAYVVIGSTSSKNSAANGTFTLNFNNSIAEFTNQLTFAEPTSGKNPTFVMNVKDSILTTGTKLVMAAPNSTVIIDNSKVTLGNYLRNSGLLVLKNGSELTGSMIQFGENGGNDGITKVDNSTLTIVNTSVGHATDGKGKGVLIISNGATVSVDYIKDLIVKKDESSTFTTKTTDVEIKPIIADGVEKDAENDKVYHISSVDGLIWLADSVNGGNSFAGKTIVLDTDLDLKGMEWTPIGTSSNIFKGTFDGNGKTISNLKITGNNNYVGLFGVTYDGEIKNLTIHNALVSGRVGVGVVAGQPYTSKYTNITLTGHVEVNGMAYVGGVGGRNAYANWDNITINVDETSYVKACSIENGKAYRTYVGGVIGFMGEGGHTVSNVTSNIDVIGSTIDVGGIVGIAHYGNSFVNITCTGNVTITDGAEAVDVEEMGGIAGVWHNQTGYTVTLTNCKFTGKLTANITEGVDLSNNTLVGAPYSAAGTGKLNIDGVMGVVDEASFIAAITAGNKVILFNDIVMTKTFAQSNVNIDIDGNGFTITQAADCVNTYALFDLTGGKVSIKNVTFDGIKDGAVVRTVGCEFNADNITAKNCAVTQQQGLLRLMGKSTITNSTFVNNTCNMVITFNYDGANNDPQVLKTCVFENNTCNTTAVVYYVKGAGATIMGNKFLNNTVYSTGNAATLYMGFTENNMIINNVFDGNKVTTTHASTKRAAGALMIGYDAVIIGNSFVNNTVTGANAKANDVCASVYYTDIDLSGNYWGGSAPVENDDYFVEYPDRHEVIINYHLTQYAN